MSKTIGFKPEFEKKLKELRIKTKVIKNIKLFCHSTKTPFNRKLEFINESDSWRIAVNRFFIWSSTPEEFDFWKNISFK